MKQIILKDIKVLKDPEKIFYQRVSHKNYLRMEASHLHLTKLVTFLQRYQIPVVWWLFFLHNTSLWQVYKALV